MKADHRLHSQHLIPLSFEAGSVFQTPHLHLVGVVNVHFRTFSGPLSHSGVTTNDARFRGRSNLTSRAVRRKIVAAVVGGLPQISFRFGPVFFQELPAFLIGACHPLILVALSGAHADLGAYRPDGRLELVDILRIVPHRRPFRVGEMRTGKCFDNLRGCR